MLPTHASRATGSAVALAPRHRSPCSAPWRAKRRHRLTNGDLLDLQAVAPSVHVRTESGQPASAIPTSRRCTTSLNTAATRWQQSRRGYRFIDAAVGAPARRASAVEHAAGAGGPGYPALASSRQWAAERGQGVRRHVAIRVALHQFVQRWARLAFPCDAAAVVSATLATDFATDYFHARARHRARVFSPLGGPCRMSVGIPFGIGHRLGLTGSEGGVDMIRVLTAGWMTALMSRLDRALELASFGAAMA